MRPVLLLALTLLIAGSPGCDRPRSVPTPEPPSVAMSLTEAHQKHMSSLMEIEGVVGTYESRDDDGNPCIKVMVVEIDDALRERIPASLEGYPVVLVPTGEIVPRSDS